MTKKKMVKTSKEEQIGFHKGALSTLTKEREELLRLIAIVEQIMQMHISALKEFGVDLAKEVGSENKKIQPKGTDKPIDDLL